MNTEICFIYRDGSNYKYATRIILKGTVSEEEIMSLENYLFEGDGFIPEQIGVSCIRPSEFTVDDHPFCELHPEDFDLTDEQPTEKMTAAEFIQAIKDIDGNWSHDFSW